MRVFLKIDKFVEKLQTYVCFALLCAIVLLGSIAVFSRFVFNLSIPWAEEFLRYSCVWLVFIGSSLTVRNDGHVSIDLLQEYLKNHKVRAVLYAASRLVGVAFLAVLFPASITLVLRSQNSMAASLPISFFYVYAAVPVGIVLMLWSYLTALPRRTKEILEEGDG